MAGYDFLSNRVIMATTATVKRTIMSLFLWKPSYELGIPEIDADHRQLVSMINDLYTAIKAGHGAVFRGQTIDGLLDYVRRHFETEESFMRACRYPLLADHQQAHRIFQEELVAMDQSRRTGSSPSAIDLLTFLCNWMRDHVTTVDRELGVYLRKVSG
jgi:hemerythrin